MLIETCLRIWKRIARAALAATVLGAVLAGCASAPAPQSSTNAADYKGRAVTRTEGGVRVSTAVAVGRRERRGLRRAAREAARSSPSGSKSRTAKTAPTICCRRDSIRISFPPPKRPKRCRSGELAERRAELDRRFRELAFHNPVLPGATTLGVRADEPRRGREARPDRPGRERAREDVLDPRDRARLSRRLPCERSVPAGHLPARGDRELHRRRRLPGGARGAALLCDQQDRLEERRSAQSGGRGRPRRCLSRARAPRLAPDRGEVVGIGLADGDIRAFARALPVCAGERSLPVRPGPGPRAAEGARQHPPAQPPAALAEPDALPRQAGVGRPDQPRHRQPPDHPFADASRPTRSTPTWTKRAPRWPRTWPIRRILPSSGS